MIKVSKLTKREDALVLRSLDREFTALANVMHTNGGFSFYLADYKTEDGDTLGCTTPNGVDYKVVRLGKDLFDEYVDGVKTASRVSAEHIKNTWS